MFTAIHGDSFNELVVNSYNTILGKGRQQGSRNGAITCINNAILNLSNPHNRHLSLDGRKSNIIAQIAETFWVMAGDDLIDPYLSFFLPRAVDYSDDGVTWRGAYGPRLYLYNQLHDALDAFVSDGILTRQSVVQILLPELDSKFALTTQKGCEDGKTKDRPCNNELVFFCEPCGIDQYKFHMNVMQRSGDGVWGALNINVFEWTFLQEMMLNNLRELYPDLDIVMGEYTHFVTNLHIYDFTESQAVEVCRNYAGEKLNFMDNEGIMLTTGEVDSDQQFFSKLVDLFSEMIQDETNEINYEWFETNSNKLSDLFSSFNLPRMENLLWD